MRQRLPKIATKDQKLGEKHRHKVEKVKFTGWTFGIREEKSQRSLQMREEINFGHAGFEICVRQASGDVEYSKLDLSL